MGNFTAPLKIIALVILSVRGYRLACRSNQQHTDAYQNAAFSNGRCERLHLTMDTLGAMVFGIVIGRTRRVLAALPKRAC